MPRTCVLPLLIALTAAPIFRAEAQAKPAAKKKSSSSESTKESAAAEAKVREATASIQRETDLLHEAVLAMRYHMGSTAELESIEVRKGSSPASLPVSGSSLFVSNDLSAAWIISDDEISVSISNPSNSLIRVLWDRAVYVDPSNASHRLIHSGIRLVDRHAPQSPTVIAPNSRVDESVYPSDHFSFERGWQKKHLFTSSDISDRIAILLPVETDGQIRDYSFTFRIRAVDPANLRRKEQEALVATIETGASLQQIVAAIGREPDRAEQQETSAGLFQRVEFHVERLAFELLDGNLENIVLLSP